MDGKGRLIGASKDWKTGKMQVTFQMDHDLSGELESITGKDLHVTAKVWREHRSLDANALLWHCLGEIAGALNADKWDIYLKMLGRYGKFTYIIVREDVVDAVKAQWRETQVVGEIEVNGQKGVQMLCYFGSSTYDSKEFSKLLNGVISEMEEMGLETPPSSDMRRALDEWEKQHNASE